MIRWRRCQRSEKTETSWGAVRIQSVSERAAAVADTAAVVVVAGVVVKVVGLA